MHIGWIYLPALVLTSSLIRQSVSVKMPAHPSPNHLFVNPVLPFTRERFGETLVSHMKPSAAIGDITMVNSYGCRLQHRSIGKRMWRRRNAPEAWSDVDRQCCRHFCRGWYTKKLWPMTLHLVPKWHLKLGADAVELNFSCPNVKGKEGQIYKSAEFSGRIGTRRPEAHW